MSMIEPMADTGWMFQVPPFPGESFGHYLGRFRRANCLSQSGLAELISIDPRLLRGLEMPSVGQFLSAKQLRTLSNLLRLTEAQMTEMLPQQRSQLHLATRLCPQCYADAPIHQKVWRRSAMMQCDRHHEPFLTACPACYTTFRLPALWENGCCEQCWLPFSQMRFQSG